MDSLLICLINASSCAVVRHCQVSEFDSALELVMHLCLRLRVLRWRPDLLAIA